MQHSSGPPTSPPFCPYTQALPPPLHFVPTPRPSHLPSILSLHPVPHTSPLFSPYTQENVTCNWDCNSAGIVTPDMSNSTRFSNCMRLYIVSAPALERYTTIGATMIKAPNSRTFVCFQQACNGKSQVAHCERCQLWKRFVGLVEVNSQKRFVIELQEM